MIRKLIVIVLAVLVVAGGLLVYAFFRAPQGATGPMTAVPIAAQPADAPAAAPGGDAAAADASAAAAGGDAAAPADAPGGAAAEPAQPATAADESGVAPAGESTLLELVPGESEARFIIDEVLRGEPKTVVGSTDQVAGQLAVLPDDLSMAQVGTIQVNARTIATDSELRNRAIKNRILRTDQFEFATFTPRQVVGLSGAGAVGQSYTFQIVGDLTIAGVTREVTFDVTATPVSGSRIEGLAVTEFLYRDFELAIPDSPSVDTVADQVRLELEFVAEAVG